MGETSHHTVSHNPQLNLSFSSPPSPNLSGILPSPRPRSRLRQRIEAQTLRDIMVWHIGITQIRDSGKDLEGTVGARTCHGTSEEAGGAETVEAEMTIGWAGFVDEAGFYGPGWDGAGVGACVGEGAAGGDVEELAAGDVDG